MVAVVGCARTANKIYRRLTTDCEQTTSGSYELPNVLCWTLFPASNADSLDRRTLGLATKTIAYQLLALEQLP